MEQVTFKRLANGNSVVIINGTHIQCREVEIQNLEYPILEVDETIFGVFASYKPVKGRSQLKSLCFCSGSEAIIVNIPKVEGLHVNVEENEEGDVPQVLKDFCLNPEHVFVSFKTEYLIQELMQFSILFNKKKTKDIQDFGVWSKKGKYNFNSIVKKLLNMEVTLPSSSSDGYVVATLVAKAYLALRVYQSNA